MKNSIVLILLVATFLSSCTNKDDGNLTPYKTEKISGVSQKGPFLNGSSLTIFELDGSFDQTGKSFITQITDNSGSFELDNISLLTQYAKLKADGYYFNEVKNINSLGPVSLFALSDLSNSSTININLLTTLELSRVEYLISNGSNFNDAKHQAQQEILSMFFISKPTMAASELLDISVNGDDNAILLAISLIIQGFRADAELSQLLGDISNDIRTDGILNSQSLSSALINDVTLFDTVQIRNNIENKYNSLGITTVIPHFEPYIKQFLDSCTYTFTNYITYPENGLWGINVLNTQDSVFINMADCSFCAYLPEGTTLKIFSPTNYSMDSAAISFAVGFDDGWIILGPGSPYMTLESTKNGLIDWRAWPHAYEGGGVFTLYFYENNSVSPTRTKNIYVQ
ncbi:MAG: hypothetical protein K9H64_02345 [Bacteroidales bacterium]|nr:hypothetical protein [Bacteroidales bacterium]MCF8454922.1 hypothetical protein [Bacteroidales bacterium]